MKKEYHLTITRKDRIYLVLFVTALLGWELIKPLIARPKVISQQASFMTADSVDNVQKVKALFQNLLLMIKLNFLSMSIRLRTMKLKLIHLFPS